MLGFRTLYVAFEFHSGQLTGWKIVVFETTENSLSVESNNDNGTKVIEKILI